MIPDRSALRRTLLEVLRSSGDILIKNFGRARIRYKGRANIVTQVDHASEENILRRVLRRFPDHDYLAEERAARRTGSDHLWVIDPVDGTTNYAHGYPVSCVSVGLLFRAKPILGGVYDPFRNELFFAEEGRGATLNGRRMRVSRAPSLRQSLLVTGFPYDRTRRSRTYVRYYRLFMERCHDVRRGGSAALDLAWVAAGRADGFWEFSLSPWDVAAGLLLVREAGGKVTDFAGNPWTDPNRYGFETLATNGRIHAAMRKILAA